MSSLRRVTSFASAPFAVTALLWGCAQGGIADPSADFDPTLPEVDASWKPLPETPSSKAPESAERDDPSTAEPEPPDDDDEQTPPTSAPVDAGAPPKPPTTSAPKPTQGEVLITEVMYDPSGNEPATEWIEVYNRASGARTLSGLTIVDGGNRTHTIGAGVTIAAGAYVALVRSQSAALSAKVPLSAIAYDYGAGVSSSSGVQLANGATGGVWLRDGSTNVAQADYGGWFSQGGGSSIQLKSLTWAASGQKASWCLSSTPWTAGSENGTPGAPADCP